MTSPVGRADFFALEAGEYLDQLGTALGASPPPVEELVRITRALRGAAMMAGPSAFAKAAAALERVAKAWRDGSVTWTPPVADTLHRTLAAFRVLVDRARTWSDGDTATADDATRALDALLEGRAEAPRARQATGLEPGVRQFVAREASHIAGALEALASAGSAPPPDALRAMLGRMHSLHGLAPLDDLAPLGVVLDGLERASSELLRGYPAPAATGELFAAACASLTAVAEALGGDGRPGEAARNEASRFATLLYELFAAERDVVPIAQVLDPFVPPAPGAPSPAATPDPLDLVSLGDRFRQAAAQLAADADEVARRIHLYTLVATLRSLPDVAGSAAVRPFTQAVVAAVASDTALTHPDRVIAALQAAAQPLGEATRVSAEDLAADLTLAAGLLAAPAAPSPSPLEPDDDIVPIETLLMAEPESAVAAAEVAEEGDAVDRSGWTALERSLATLHRLRHAPAVAPAPVIAEDAGLPEPEPAPAPEPEEEILSIDAFLYRGAAARARVDEVRRELTASIATTGLAPDLQPLLEELLDLVPLAFDDAR